MPTSVLVGIIVCGGLKKACYNTIAYLIGRRPIREQWSFRFLSYCHFLKPTTVTNAKFYFISEKLVIENAQRMIYSMTGAHISKAFLPWYDTLAVMISMLYYILQGWELEIELRTSCMLVKYYANELHSSSKC